MGTQPPIARPLRHAPTADGGSIVTKLNWYSATGHGYMVEMLLTQALAEAINERGHPWMRVDYSGERPAPGTPLVITGPEEVARLMTEKYSEQEEDGALREVLVNRGNKAIGLPQQDSTRWHVLQVLRAA